jgi:hypothetical protein
MAEHFSGEILMRTICAFLSALPFLTVAAALSASAEIGPCVSDRDGGLTCGEDPGAARVVEVYVVRAFRTVGLAI